MAIIYRPQTTNDPGDPPSATSESFVAGDIYIFEGYLSGDLNGVDGAIASYLSLTSGFQAFWDLSLVGDIYASYCSFTDINVISGVVYADNTCEGINSNNSGIIFSGASGVDYLHNNIFIDYNLSANQIATGSNYDHNINYFNFVPNNHLINIGSNYNHTSSFVDFFANVHQFANNVEIQHVLKNLIFSTNNSLISAGSNYSHTVKYIEFITQNNSDFGINVVSSPSYFEFICNQHQVGSSVDIYHSGIFLEFINQEHNTSIGVNFSGSVQFINYEKQSHAPAIEVNYYHDQSIIEFITIGEAHTNIDIIHSGLFIEYLTCGGTFKNCFYEFVGYSYPSRIPAAYGNPARIRPRIRRCTT